MLNTWQNKDLNHVSKKIPAWCDPVPQHPLCMYIPLFIILMENIPFNVLSALTQLWPLWPLQLWCREVPSRPPPPESLSLSLLPLLSLSLWLPWTSHSRHKVPNLTLLQQAINSDSECVCMCVCPLVFLSKISIPFLLSLFSASLLRELLIHKSRFQFRSWSDKKPKVKGYRLQWTHYPKRN